jgi:anaerobic selenocysteine-containing dehydrogenase
VGRRRPLCDLHEAGHPADVRCRDDRAIFAELAQRPGINDYDDKTEEQWLRDLTKDAVDDFEAFRDAGVARFAAPQDAVAFAAQIRDPDNHKFTTPSGKIEIYSLAMAAKPDRYGLGAMPPIPTRSSPTRSTCRCYAARRRGGSWKSRGCASSTIGARRCCR